jgi:hypothetical protein
VLGDRGNLRALRLQRLLVGDPCRLCLEAGQRVEQIGARIEVDRWRRRGQHLLRPIVQRSAPQVAGTHRSRDQREQLDRLRRHHGQQFASQTGR